MDSEKKILNKNKYALKKRRMCRNLFYLLYTVGIDMMTITQLINRVIMCTKIIPVSLAIYQYSVCALIQSF